jgi:hypothetical protein
MRIVTSAGILLGVTLVSGCNKSDQPAPQPSPAPVAPAPAAPVVTSPVPGAPATEAPPTAPPTAPEAPPTAAVPPPEAAPTAPPTAPEAPPEAAPEGVAPSVAPTQPTLPPPPEGLKIVGAREDVVARLLTKEPGCVAITKDSGYVVSLVETDAGLTARVWSPPAEGTTTYGEGEEAIVTEVPLLASPDHSTIAWTTPEAMVAHEAIRTALAQPDAVPCQTLRLEEGAPVTLPLPTPVTAELLAGGVRLSREGTPAVGARRRDTDGAFYAFEALFWSPEASHVLVRFVAPPAAGAEGRTSLSYRMRSVPLSALEPRTCIPRPTEGKPLEAPAAPAFNAAETSGCVAMTADGKMAALRTYSVDRADRKKSQPAEVRWYGAGAAPDIDLSCYAKKCSKEQQEAATARAAELGLVACAPVKGPIALDGMKVPFMYQNEELKLKTAGRFVSLAAFEPFTPTGGREGLWKMWQHPAGGPVFVWAGYNDDAGEGVGVRVLDDAGMNLCPK